MSLFSRGQPQQWIDGDSGSTLLIQVRGLLLAALLAAPAQTVAVVTGVKADAAPQSISFNQPATVTVTWIVDTTTSNPTTNTITSTSGEFLGPAVIGTNPVVLTRSFSSPASLPVSTTVTEVVRIPSSITYQANRNGQATFRYARFFTDVDGATGGLGGFATINIGSSSGGELILSRLELRFDTNEIVRIAGQDEKLTAIAEINYAGAGLLDAVWEVADPSSTRGDPVFVPVSILRQYLGAGRHVVLRSPPLPSAIIGTHFVRLRIRQPENAIEFPVLTYQVIKQALDARDDLAVIRLTSPRPMARYTADTEFSWQAVEGASAYQLEIHDVGIAGIDSVAERSVEESSDSYAMARGQSTPVTGILIPAARTTTTLSALSSQYLRPAHRYRWRVIAIGPGGSVIGESGLQEINTP